MGAEFDAVYQFPDVRCVGNTERAIKVVIPGYDDPIWIPQSQVDDRSEVWKRGDEGVLWISEWIAKEKGLTEV